MFERASTGIPGLDRVLDDLRWGDNVVWQVDQIQDYAYFARNFATSAVTQEKPLIYFRFGAHPPILEPGPGVKIIPVDPAVGFESFSGTIREIATQAGERVCYVFDSLSELLSEWGTDLMIGNFFMVTCPYLFELKTIAYFGLLRNCHSFQTIARIRETTQLLLDVFAKDRYYIHPLKVWQRYSPTMFLPHAAEGPNYIPLTSSAEMAKVFDKHPQSFGNAERALDYWDHIFIKAGELARNLTDNQELRQQRASILNQLLTMVISREQRLLDLARKYLTIEDLLTIKGRMIGSGLIGGKAVGLILARKILASDPEGNWEELLEPHDSFYIGTDVYYTYLVENGCWQLRQEQKKPEKYYTAAAELQAKLRRGVFPEVIKRQFQEMLEYFGQAPIIVRSSSLLEDGFGNAFAGKYESVFCANQGDPEERFNNFLEAVRTVYASTMNPDALAYRLQRGLADCDEQMALLVQRVSGSYHGNYFFPDLAGVALSHNLYVWHDQMKPEAGMIRLVLGLGTRAVDRSGDDYARIVALDQPQLQPDPDPAYTQHDVDLLNLEQNKFDTVSLQTLAGARLIPNLSFFATREWISEPRPMERWTLDFRHLLQETDFPGVIGKMLQTLEKAYGYPVDTEFTVNFRSGGGYYLNLLQCRPLQVKRYRKQAAIPEEIPSEATIFKTRDRFMGGSLELKLARLIWIVPQAYAALPIAAKYQLARIIGKLNRLIPDREESPTALLGPGRWGTSTPSLGIPVSFAEINRFAVLGELAFTTGGFMPELSYGTHFFHDLVETDIFYLTLNEAKEGTVFNREFFAEEPNRLASLLPDEAGFWGETVKVIEAPPNEEIWLHADLTAKKVICWRKHL